MNEEIIEHFRQTIQLTHKRKPRVPAPIPGMTSKDIEKQVEDFIAKGGKIEKFEQGELGPQKIIQFNNKKVPIKKAYKR